MTKVILLAPLPVCTLYARHCLHQNNHRPCRPDRNGAGPAKWVVSEARKQGTVYVKRALDQVGDGDMQVEWLRELGPSLQRT